MKAQKEIHLVGAAAAALVGTIVVVFLVQWGIFHGVMELGQYAGLYEYEPTPAGSLFATFAFSILSGLFRVVRSRGD